MKTEQIKFGVKENGKVKNIGTLDAPRYESPEELLQEVPGDIILTRFHRANDIFLQGQARLVATGGRVSAKAKLDTIQMEYIKLGVLLDDEAIDQHEYQRRLNKIMVGEPKE